MFTLLLSAIFYCLPARPVRAAIIPFATVGTEPNSGVTAGPMPVWLGTNKDGSIQSILAPALTYNVMFGATPALHYYWFPDARSKLSLTLSKSQYVNYRAGVKYDTHDSDAGRSWSYEFNDEAQGSMRFYGYGPLTSKSSAQMYAQKEVLASFLVSQNLGASPWRVSAGWGYRSVGIGPGVGAGIPQIDLSMQGYSAVGGPRLGLAFDTRDFPTTPTRGTFLSVDASFMSPSFGSDSAYRAVDFQASQYIPEGDRLTTAMRFGLQTRSGPGTLPFAGMATLGGDSSLRGYGDSRFMGRNSAIFTVEERWAVYRIHAKGAVADIQIAPFAEVGTVFDHVSDISWKTLLPTFGIGLRAVVKPSVVGKLDIGYGRDGIAVFAGLGYPF
jgi:outer membrane protein assembly factor BamA